MKKSKLKKKIAKLKAKNYNQKHNIEVLRQQLFDLKKAIAENNVEALEIAKSEYHLQLELESSVWFGERKEGLMKYDGLFSILEDMPPRQVLNVEKLTPNEVIARYGTFFNALQVKEILEGKPIDEVLKHNIKE